MRTLAKGRLVITATAITGFLLIAAALVITFTSASARAGSLPTSDELLSVRIAQAEDECLVCHQNSTPGIVSQHLASNHFTANTTCSDCHLVNQDTPGAVQHPDEDFFVLARSSSGMCAACHLQEVQQFSLSRHALPSYVAYAGAQGLTEAQLELYQAIPEGGADPFGRSLQARNIIHAMEGEAFTQFTCESCHDVGAPNPDGSVGDCTACHIRHEFSLEQARRPETCNNCHIGPDHPQWEIYFESSHGIAYSTMGDEWNWEAEPGTLTTVDMPAPTCATCHFSGFGTSATTHDVGDRLGWYLAAAITTERPNFYENRLRMQGVCRACHSDGFIEEFYVSADEAVATVNDFVRFSDAIMQPLRANGLLTTTPFDEPIEYVHYELWHHYGRTAKSGVWMQGADYAQWHGVYEILKDLVELRDMADEILVANGYPPLEMPAGFPSIDAARAYLSAPEVTPESTPPNPAVDLLVTPVGAENAPGVGADGQLNPTPAPPEATAEAGS